MELQRLLTGDPGRTGAIYLAIGGVSLVKAIVLRNDSTRFRRELADAALFIGVGLVLRRFDTMRSEKRDELEQAVPAWLLGGEASGSAGGVRERAMGLFESEPEPEPERSITDRARRIVG